VPAWSRSSNISKDEKSKLLVSLSGTYRTVDSRNNKYSKYTAIKTVLSEKRGKAVVSREGSEPFTLQLYGCDVPN